MPGMNSRVMYMGASALTCMVGRVSSPLSVSQKYRLPRTMPALLMSTSGLPTSRRTRWAVLAIAPRSPTSTTYDRTAVRPREIAPSSSAALASAAASRSQRVTDAACSATARSAYMRPMPPAAPVMSTFAPCTVLVIAPSSRTRMSTSSAPSSVGGRLGLAPLPHDLGRHPRDEVVGHGLRVGEVHGVGVGAERCDLGLEPAVEPGHGIEADVVLPPREVDGVASAEHDRGDAVAHLLLAVGHGRVDRRAHAFEHVAHVVGKGREVLLHRLRSGCHACSVQH